MFPASVGIFITIILNFLLDKSRVSFSLKSISRIFILLFCLEHIFLFLHFPSLCVGFCALDKPVTFLSLEEWLCLGDEPCLSSWLFLKALCLSRFFLNVSQLLRVCQDLSVSQREEFHSSPRYRLLGTTPSGAFKVCRYISFRGRLGDVCFCLLPLH